MLFIVCSLQSYVPTVFENYTASFEIDTQRIELSLWDTSGNYDLPFLLPSFPSPLLCTSCSLQINSGAMSGHVQTCRSLHNSRVTPVDMLSCLERGGVRVAFNLFGHVFTN